MRRERHISESKARKSPVSVPEAKEVLKGIDPNAADQIQKRALDYLEKFSKIDVGKAKRIKGDLQEKCGLTEDEAIELVNVMPKTVEELRVFTAGWKKLLPTETVDKILKILSS